MQALGAAFTPFAHLEAQKGCGVLVMNFALAALAEFFGFV